jgi:hypothetical protein
MMVKSFFFFWRAALVRYTDARTATPYDEVGEVFGKVFGKGLCRK